jgi:hypothetical protein
MKRALQQLLKAAEIYVPFASTATNHKWLQLALSLTQLASVAGGQLLQAVYRKGLDLAPAPNPSPPITKAAT